MEVKAKELIIVGGPNGVGKTTLAEKISTERSALFLAADKIAAELSPDDPAAARIEAASQFVTQFESQLGRVNALVVESTLSGRTLRHRIQDAKEQGYVITIVFIFLDSAEVCVDRVAERVRKGGHFVPESDIRRRFRAIVNFWNMYRPMADHWLLTYNSGKVPVDVALGTADTISVRDSERFAVFQGFWTQDDMASSITNLETYQKADELIAAFRSAVRDAQAESHALGVPNVYYLDGVRYFELPDGTITQTEQHAVQRDGA